MADDRFGNVWIVVAAYNEGATLRTTLAGLLSEFANIVVVDDCSSDNTGAIALEAGAHVCTHAVNLGQGAALQTGIDYALSQGAELIVTFDADGQHRVADAVAMIAAQRSSGFDAILASRFLGSTEGMSRVRGLTLRLATLFTRITTGLNLTDTHNGLRVLSAAAVRAIRIRHNRMAHASEILDQIAALHLSYAEFPAKIIYTEYSRAKGQKLSGALRIITDLFLGRMYR